MVIVCPLVNVAGHLNSIHKEGKRVKKIVRLIKSFLNSNPKNKKVRVFYCKNIIILITYN